MTTSLSGKTPLPWQRYWKRSCGVSRAITNMLSASICASFLKPHPYQESDMHRNLFALAATLALLVTGIEAHAACTAANPNPNVAEDTPTSAFTDNGDGTVTHSLTGLMWKQCAEGLSGAGCATGGPVPAKTWSEALVAAKNANFAGHSDWRLPNKKELESIVETCGHTPAINQTLFPAIPGNFFWSGSSYVLDPTLAWYFRFNSDGASFAVNKGSILYVRLVRGGQPFDTFDAQGDFIPTAFSFIAQTGAALSTVATSNTISVAGINTVSPISIVGGTYKINGGGYTAVAGTVNNGDTVTVKQTSSASYGTLTTSTLTIGGVAGTFDVTTLAQDTTPAAFTFTAQTGVALSSVATSNTITVAGINSAANISIAGGTYSKNGGAYTAVAGTVNNGDTVTLRQTASASYSTSTTATLTIGGVSGAFNVTTLPVPGTTSYTAPSATGTGNITASFTGGGAGCGYTVSQYIPLTGHAASPPAGSAPSGVSFPQGLFDFTLGGCTAASTITLTITYPQALPAGAVYWKYGPAPGNAVPHWYQLPQPSPATPPPSASPTAGWATTTSRPTAPSSIRVGRGCRAAARAGIPTLSEWGLILLAGMLGVFGVVGLRRGDAA